ncbi:MAG: MltA domain-containing protein [Bdellovibrionales bacterium]
MDVAALMMSLKNLGNGLPIKAISILLFLFNLNCVFIPEFERANLPPRMIERICDQANSLAPAPNADFVTPTARVSIAEYPDFNDDLDFEGVELVLQRQLERYKERSMIGSITFGQDRYPLIRVKESLIRFGELVRAAKQCTQSGKKSKEKCWADFRGQLHEQFVLYAPKLAPEDPRFGESGQVLFTGYYTPHLEVSLWRTEEYSIPIYAKPDDEWVNRAGRYQIDFQSVLAGRGLELFYAKDRFAVYLLHLEGGGRVSYRDVQGIQHSEYVSYAGSNGRQWRFLSTQMLDRNWITDPAVPFQRQFIEENPQLEPQIFSYCPSYVFFRPTYHPPEGSDLVPLTDNRSIATDRNNYGFKGVLAFVSAKRPRPLSHDNNKDIEMMPFSRFVLDQDTGGSIKGKARVDFYFGEGEYAELAANTVKQRGDIYFLMLKSEDGAP